MAEYIDREKLKRDLIDNRSFYPAIVKNAIENAPTEDVVPRSELEGLQKKYEEKIAELEREVEDLESTQEITPEAKHFIDTKADKLISLLTEINKTQDQVKQEVAKQIFEEIEKILVRPEAPTALFYHCSKHSYNELKKKYIGE